MDTDISNTDTQSQTVSMGEASVAVGRGGNDSAQGMEAVSDRPPIDYARLVDSQGRFTQKVAGKFDTLEGLIKSYESAERMIASGNKVAVPSEYSSQEEWADFYTKIGRPENADGYEFKVSDEVKALPDVYDEEGLKAFGQLAHSVGLTSAQASAVADMYFKGMEQQHTQAAEQAKAAEAGIEVELSKEWGPKDGPRWNRAMELVGHGAELVGLDAEALSAIAVPHRASFARAFARVAQMSAERPAAGLGGGASSGALDNGVQGRIDAIMQDRAHPFWDSRAPGHQRAVDEISHLFKLREAGG